MIVEMRIDTLHPGTVSKFEERFREALPSRTKLSRLGAFWRTEIGTLNQVIHLWPYENLDDFARVRAAEVMLKDWPPKIGEYIVGQQCDLFTLAPFSPLIQPGQYGSVYDIRTETLVQGGIPHFISRWSERITERMKLSPLIATMHSEVGGLNKIVHIWGYKDMADREHIRAEAIRLGVWPLGTHDMGIVLRQEVMVVKPATFSPIL